MRRRANRHPLDADKIKRCRLVNTIWPCIKAVQVRTVTRKEINKSFCMHRMSLITPQQIHISHFDYRYLIRLLRILITHTHWTAQSEAH